MRFSVYNWIGGLALLAWGLLAATSSTLHATAVQQADNLLTNSGFEDETAWTLCSGAAIVDTAAYTGQQALRLGPPTGVGCEDEVVELGPKQVAYQEVTIPADAQTVTVSFWYQRTGDPDAGENELAVVLVSEPDAIVKEVQLDSLYGYDLGGWMLYRQTLTPAQLETARGQTWLFAFQLENSASGTNDIAFFIDEVQVQLADVATPAAPLPADLVGDASQPIVVTQFDEENSTEEESNFAVYRTNTDGTQRQRIYTGLNGSPNFATWAPDGSRVAVVDPFVSNPIDATESGLIGILSTLEPNGSDLREVYRTEGGGGELGPPEEANVDTRITSIAWSPDGTALGATVCGRARFTGGTTDEICRLDFIDVATGNRTGVVEDVFSFDWGSDNRILFSAPAFGDRVSGIYELDLNAATPAPVLLVRTWANEIPFREERNPVWAPDGEHFVVTREVAGQRLNAEGELEQNTALVRYNRADTSTPELLVLADQGTNSGTPAFSPDGTYLLYTLFGADAPVSVWWLRVTDGSTGPLLVNGASVSADWLAMEVPDTPGAIRVYLPAIQR